MDEDLASRVFALVSKFDSDTLTVFRLYCIQAMSAAQVARELRCSRVTIWRRLQAIRAKTGIDPADLRKISPHIAKIENEFSDSRARHIHRQNLLDNHHEDSIE